MAVDLGDYSSGFRHSEVIRFINNEILMNGGGPEFYSAFRMRPWNEIEDHLRTILIDPEVPRSLKRACTWSALALSVRVGARQREQQAYMVGLPQDEMGQSPSAPRASVSELWQLRQQREEAVSQLRSTQAALQQAMRECDMLRRRLYPAERASQMAPLVQDVPGAHTQQLGASVVPLNPDHSRAMGAMGGYDRQYLEAQMSAATNVFYMPESTTPWPLGMQPSVPVSVPYQLPPHPPFLMGSPFIMPFPSPVVMDTEAGVVVPVPMPSVYPSGPLVAPYSQDPADQWNQRLYMAAEGPPVSQPSVPPGNVRDAKQEGDLQKPQDKDTLGDIGSYIQGQAPQRTQERATLANTGNDSEVGEDDEEEDEDKEEATRAAPAEAKAAQVAETAAEEAEAAAEEAEVEADDEYEDDDEEDEYDDDYDDYYDDDDDDDDDAETEEKEEEAAAAMAATAYDYTAVEGLWSLQELRLNEEEELHSPSEKSLEASAPDPLGSRESQSKGVEGALPTPVWQSWSQAVRESPKKQQPLLPKKDKPQVEPPSESQPVVNWLCPKCKAVNFSWRTVCYKCKRVNMPAEGGGKTTDTRRW